MGRTVPSFRMALEMEMTKWAGYRKCLRSNEREIFDRMMDDCRIHASASGMAVRTNPIEAVIMPESNCLLRMQGMRAVDGKGLLVREVFRSVQFS